MKSARGIKGTTVFQFLSPEKPARAHFRRLIENVAFMFSQLRKDENTIKGK